MGDVHCWVLLAGLQRDLRATEQPEDARLDQHRLHERALRAQRRKLRPCGRLREIRTEPGVRIATPAAPRADGAEVVPPFRPARTGAKAAACAMRPARRSAGEGSGAVRRACRLSLPDQQSRARVAKRVVTGAKIGLRANGGKEIANRNLRAALVTGWYGAAIHRAATGSVVG